jgi:hypothetical protein
MQIVNVHTNKLLDCSNLQTTGPVSRQRGRPTETGQQIPDPNSWKRKQYLVKRLFVDFKKAYDSMMKAVLYSILIEFGVPMKLDRLIRVYLNETYT